MIKISKIVRKYLKWINLQVVSKDKCVNGIKRGSSTGNFCNNQTGPKREGMPFIGMIKLGVLKIC